MSLGPGDFSLRSDKDSRSDTDCGGYLLTPHLSMGQISTAATVSCLCWPLLPPGSSAKQTLRSLLPADSMNVATNVHPFWIATWVPLYH